MAATTLNRYPLCSICDSTSSNISGPKESGGSCYCGGGDKVHPNRPLFASVSQVGLCYSSKFLNILRVQLHTACTSATLQIAYGSTKGIDHDKRFTCAFG